MKNKKQLSFWLEGRSYSKLIRDMWIDGEIGNLFGLLDVGNQFSTDQMLDFVFGKLEFIGDTRKNGELILTDNFEYSSDDLKYIQNIPSIEQLIVKLEESYISNDFNIRLFQYQNKMHEVELKETGDKIDLDNLIKKQQNVIKNLSLLYPLIGRDVVDYPINKHIPLLSEYDNQKILFNAEIKKRITDKSISNLILKSNSKYISKSSRKKINKTIESLHENDIKVTTYNTPNEPTIGHKTIIYDNGLISPNGFFYPCEFTQHKDFALNFSNKKNAELDLENRGWIKMSNNKFYMNELKRCTKKQKNMIIDYMNKMKYNKIYFNHNSLNQKQIMD